MRLFLPVTRLLAITMVMLVALVVPLTVSAAETKSPESLGSSVQTVAQSFSTTTALQQGIIVQLDAKNTQAVVPATYAQSDRQFGVVVAPNDAPVSLSSSEQQQSAYVVTSGRYKVLVSSQNGAIKTGDFVSISAVSGVGMKADTKQTSVLGRAVDGFDGKTNSLSTTTLKQSTGGDVKVNIASITVDIAVGPNKLLAANDDGVPDVIQSLAKSIVGKPISATQLYISAAILIVGMGVVASLLYSGIQTGMTAIGRNPLARKSIMRNLVQVIISGILIFIGCLFAVYLVLKL